MSAERAADNSAARRFAGDIVAAADAAGIVVRLIGGIAVSMHAPSSFDGPMTRSHEDIDLVIHSGARAKLDRVLGDLGYEPDRRFNALNGADRRLYYMEGGPKLDVFVGEFRMCHTIPMEERLTADHPTVPVAELVITKGQIVHLTDKDAGDLIALLLDHDIANHDDDAINATRIADLCARDWGLWRTMTQTLDRVEATLPHAAIDEDARESVRARLDGLRAAIEAAPKSSKWRLRSRVGDRKVWYELPEDPRRDTGESADPASARDA